MTSSKMGFEVDDMPTVGSSADEFETDDSEEGSCVYLMVIGVRVLRIF